MIKTIYRTTTAKQFEKLNKNLEKKYGEDNFIFQDWSKPADKEQIKMRHRFSIVSKR